MKLDTGTELPSKFELTDEFKDLFELIENTDSILECDEYYCFGDQVKNYLTNRVNADYYSIGSVKNNFCKINSKA